MTRPPVAVDAAPRPRRAPPRTPAGAVPRAPRPVQSTVGWNCTNSRSAADGPGPQRERQAVAGGVGRVGGGWRRRCPSPPVASTTAPARAAHRPGRPSPSSAQPDDRAVVGAERVDAPMPLEHLDAAPARTAAASARATSAPVASPPACTTRTRGARPRGRAPVSRRRSRSKPGAQRDAAARPRPGPSARSRPRRPVAQPGARVSVSRRGRTLSSAGPSAAAMPPCAHAVLPSPSAPLVTTMTRGRPRGQRERRGTARPRRRRRTTTSACRSLTASARVTRRRPAGRSRSSAATARRARGRRPPGRRAPRRGPRAAQRSSTSGVIIFMYRQDAAVVHRQKSIAGVGLAQLVQHPDLGRHQHRAGAACAGARPQHPAGGQDLDPVGRAARRSPASHSADVAQPHSGWMNSSASGAPPPARRRSAALMPACTWHSPAQMRMFVPAGDPPHVRAEELVGQEQHLPVGRDRRRPPRPRWTTCSRRRPRPSPRRWCSRTRRRPRPGARPSTPAAGRR